MYTLYLKCLSVCLSVCTYGFQKLPPAECTGVAFSWSFTRLSTHACAHARTHARTCTHTAACLLDIVANVLRIDRAVLQKLKSATERADRVAEQLDEERTSAKSAGDASTTKLRKVIIPIHSCSW